MVKIVRQIYKAHHSHLSVNKPDELTNIL